METLLFNSELAYEFLPASSNEFIQIDEVLAEL